MDTSRSPFILVVGGTGTQGGNVARELLAYGHQVRVLSRNPESFAAQQIAAKGANVVKGDLGDFNALLPVMKDVTAIFSAQYADPFDPSIEPRNARNLVQAAQEMGVQQVVHTSISGTTVFPRWDKHPSLASLFDQKYAIEELVRNGGFHHWTILHPCWFMENFVEPLATLMAPGLKYGKLFGIMHPDTPLKMNSGADTALFARSAFEEPDRFHAKDINIAAEECSWNQIAATLSNALGKEVTYEQVTRQQAIDRGLLKEIVNGIEWFDETGFGFDLRETLHYGIPLKTFRQWVDENKNRIVVD